LAAAALLAGFMASTAAATAASAATPAGFHASDDGGGATDVNVCSYAVPAGYAHCNARKRTDASAHAARPGRAHAAASPSVIGNGGAYDPAYLQSAYNVPATRGAGQTVAIVDAFDDPNAATDLATYRSHWGLPACGVGCFTKVNQSGAASPLPTADAGWAEEISLDLDMVSAICPNCHILLVEANSNSDADLGASVNEAVALGANAVSNSYGGGEFSGETTFANNFYNHPGIAITASTGDSGFGVEFPAAAATVTAVGGTSLHQATNTGTRSAQERAWAGAGSGCSSQIAKPSWQTDTGCSHRTVADVSAVADPATGVWVNDTYGGDPGFEIFGGTSASSPIVASIYALAQNPSSTDTLSQYPYLTKTALNDVVGGKNGTCSPTYLCNGVAGYDGPTGLGTPNGYAAFAPSTGGGATAPATPVLTAVTGATTGVDLSWPAPANNGAPITSYQLWRGTSPGAEKSYKAIVCSTSTCTFTDTVPHGRTAYYQLTATNSAGTSSKSVEVHATGK
jgi:subtilase family serine protease